MRPVATSVLIAKDFKNQDEPSGDNPGGADPNNPTAPADPFAGIELDNLPEEVRAAVVAGRTQFATLQTNVAKATADAQRLEAERREFQSRADRNEALLRKHNLDPNGQQQQQQQSPAQVLEKELYDSYIAGGVDENNAKAWAKMNSITGSVLRKGILTEVGSAVTPHMQNTASLMVDRLLDQACTDPNLGQHLDDQKTYDTVRQYLQTLAQNGNNVDQPTIDTTVKMVVGERLMKGDFQQQQQQQYEPQQRQQVRGGSRGGNGAGFHGHVIPPNNNQQGPQAANLETANAINQVTLAMRRGMKTTK